MSKSEDGGDNIKLHIMKKCFRQKLTYSIFIALGFFLLATNNIQAQCTRTYCENLYGDGWDCWFSCSATNKCCQCKYGNSTTGEHGPLDCATSGCSNPDAHGCQPAPPTPEPPTPTSGTQPTPTGVPAKSVWLCINPGSSGSKCESDQLVCPEPDIPGAACYTTQAKCEIGCTHMTPPPITTKLIKDPLCTITAGRYGIDSAIGCFPVDNNNEMIAFILRWALGVSAGIAFLLIIYSAFLIMASGGNAERVKAGKELLTAAITGLIVLIFSVFILDLIGLRILKIPGL